MPPVAFKMSELPVVAAFGGGRTGATEPKVSIRENGQIAMNTLLGKKLVGFSAVQVLRDSEKNAIVLVPLSSEKVEALKTKDAAVFDLKAGNGEKQQTYFAGSRVLRAFGYDYKAAGNQTMDASIVTSKSGATSVWITLPTETPARKPVVARPRKAKMEAANGNGNTVVASASNAPVETPVAANAGADVDFDLS